MLNKTKYIFGFFLISVLLFYFCQKKIFKNIEAHGRIVNYITNQPISTDITLRTADATSAKNLPYVDLYKTNSSGDGTFHFKTKASRRDKYDLYIGQSSYQYAQDISLKEGSNTDLGEILIGDYTFNCQVTIVPVTSSSIEFYQSVGMTSPGYTFAPGTSTVFTHSTKYSISEYQANGNNYKLGYKIFPGSVTTYSYVNIPINSSNTLSVTINY